MSFHDFILAGAAFISEVLGVLSGFGSSTFFLPVASIFESIHLVLALTALLHCFANLSKLILFRKNLSMALFAKFMLPSLILCGLGALVNPYFSVQKVKLALGLFLIVISLVKLFMSKSLQISEKKAIPIIAASGFLTGFVGTGGALRGIALSALGFAKNDFVALSTAIDFGGDLLRAGIYLKNGYMDWAQWFYIPVLAIAAYSGAFVGRKILGYIPQVQFEKIVAVFVFMSGVVMIFTVAN